MFPPDFTKETLAHGDRGALAACSGGFALLSGLMFDTETQRNGYMWVIDYSGMTSKEMLLMDQAYVEICSKIDELAMCGLPLTCNKILHINVPRALASVLTFCRLIFPKNLRDWLIVASEKQVLELVGGVGALPRWFGSGKGQCDGCDRFTALSMAQLQSMRQAIYASWASGDSASLCVSLSVPVPQIHASGGTGGQQAVSTVALSTLDSAAVCRALQVGRPLFHHWNRSLVIGSFCSVTYY